MTAEQLRNSILQEAISGRLVPQDPNDEPASALLARIREEKARLVKEGKLKKKDLVETPITEEEIPFEIPESWKWLRYQDIADCALGKTKNPNQTDGELCPYLCSINVYWDSVRLNVLKEMLFSDTDKQKYSVENGDMLICEGGEAGRSAIYEGDVTPLYYQNALHRVRFYGHLCAKFYLYQMELYKKTGLLNEHIKGETIQHFVSTKLLNLPIPLPPLAEQKRIVAKLEELLPIVEQYGKAQTELDELNAALPTRLRQSILQEAIQGKLVPQDENDEPVDILFNRIQEEKLKLIKQNIIRKKEAVINAVKEDEIPFDIPSSWKWCHLEELVAILDGYRKPVSKHDREVGTYPYYGANGVLDYVRDYIFDGEYLLVGEDGSVITSYGNPIVNKASGKIWVNNHAHVLQECGKLGYYDYLFYALQAISIKKYIHGFMPKYSQGDLRKTIIPLPPLAEQQRIVAKIEELFAEIDKLQANN